jgi:hypothetical protein
MNLLYIRPADLRADDVVSVTEDGTQANDMRSRLQLTRYTLCAPVVPDVHYWIAVNAAGEQRVIKFSYYAYVVDGRAFADMAAGRGQVVEQSYFSQFIREGL